MTTTAIVTNCPKWCQTPPEEHAFEDRLGLPFVHLAGHADYPVAGEPWGFSIERHDRPEGPCDVLWIGDDVVDVGDAVALANAILAMVGTKVPA